MQLYEKESFIEYHHPANFGGHKDSGNGDMVILVVEKPQSWS